MARRKHRAKLLLIISISSGSGAEWLLKWLCEINVKFKEPQKPVAIGIESIINLLAPPEPDACFKRPPAKPTLCAFSGRRGRGRSFASEDGGSGCASPCTRICRKSFWVCALRQYSESEEGFERVYQGSPGFSQSGVPRPHYAKMFSPLSPNTALFGLMGVGGAGSSWFWLDEPMDTKWNERLRELRKDCRATPRRGTRIFA